MSNLIPYVFNNINVRALNIEGEIWFVAVDICKVLEIKNPSNALNRLDSDEKTTLGNTEGRAGQGAQSYNIINESGLYSLILRSRKAEAKQFKKWVTSEVLPSIRKTGQYSVASQTNNTQQLNELNQRIQAIEDKTGTPSSTSFSDIELCHLAWAYLVGEVMRTRIEKIYPILRQLGSDFAPSFYSMAYEYKENLEDTRIILERATQHINPQQQGCYQKNWETVLSRLRRGKKT